MKTENKELDKYIEFTSKTAGELLIEAMEKGNKNKYPPDMVLSVFQLLVVIAPRFVVDRLIKKRAYAAAKNVVDIQLGSLENTEAELKAMLELIEKAKKK